MDVNGLRTFGLAYDAGLYAWRVPGASGTATIAVEPALEHRRPGVRLAGRPHGDTLNEDARSTADVRLEPAWAIDALGNCVAWDGEALVSMSHLARRHGLEPRSFALPAQARKVSDLALGDDDVLYVATPVAVWLIDLRGRFDAAHLDAPAGFVPQRLAPVPGGGVWVLARDGGIGRVEGLPEFKSGVYVSRARNDLLEAEARGLHPLRWIETQAQLPSSDRAVAIAVNRSGRLAILSLGRDAGGARLRLLLDDSRLSHAVDIAGPRFPHTMGWLDGERLALATRGRLIGDDGAARDPGVWTYALPAGRIGRWIEASAEPSAGLPDELAADLQPLGDYYPLAGWNGGPFANGRPGNPLHYARESAGRREVARIARISGTERTAYGVVANVADGRVAGARVRAAPGAIDAGDPATVWHRLHAEAVLPPGCAMIVWLAAGDEAPPRFVPGAPGSRAGWHAHLFGDRAALPSAVAAALPAQTPRAAWSRSETEVPEGRSVLGCPGEPGRAGLFSVLVQRAGVAVRRIEGARLWVAVELFGDGRTTPELVALRVQGGRFSYRDRYLPALYHERLFGEDAERAGRASGADFLERFLHLFEGLFTDIEGRVAASALATDALSCPPDALPWLAGWVGLALERGMPPERSRWMLANAAKLAQRHGTLAGLQMALDIATGGAVSAGRILVLEDFRLRRTLATILGASLEDAADPLTAGITRSGNSVVGDALFLGDARSLDDGALKAFLALFRRLGSADPGREALLAKEQTAANQALFDDLAHRVTVLVHDALPPDELGLVQRLVELGAPAHVLSRVVPARYPFLVGVAALVGADTFLRPAPAWRPIRVCSAADVANGAPEGSEVGGVDTLGGEGSLDAHAGAFAGVLEPLDGSQ